ncbi:O-methyltransferase [Acidobacteria bacterium AH-259-L09]|nr:O-methyltransferase [Acidobacteria bacterium AH-259-L09]
MLKKTALGLVVTVVLLVAAHLDAQERGRGRPGPRRPTGGGPGPSSIESSPIPQTEAQKRILSILEDMDQNQRRGMMNVPLEDGRLLRLLTETVDAKHVVEIGTSNGYSAIWFCLGLRATGGKLTTHEIDPHRASLARENFKRAGVDQIVTLVEGNAHEEVMKLNESIDILFLDADKPGYLDYLNKLLPLVRPGGLILAHNMNRPAPDPRYIKAITTNPDLETIFLNMHAAGVGVTLKKR